MSWWQRWFARRDADSEAQDQYEQAVLIDLPLSNDDVGTDAERDTIHALSRELEKTVAEQQVGEFDGEEFCDGRSTLYLYGPDADRLFDAIEPVLRRFALTRGGKAIKCYQPIPGRDPGEVEIPL